MDTLYLLSQVYFRLRAVLAAALSSPFLQTTAVLLVAVLVADRFASQPTPMVGVQAAGMIGAGGAPARVSGAPADERLIAWSVLAERGASGKAERSAMEHLFKAGEPLSGLVFSGGDVDLSGLDLGATADQRAVLRGVGFSGVRMMGAKLMGADMTGADFTAAILTRTDFTGADLDQAKLGGADMGAAVLRRASLQRARLSGAILTGAEMSDVVATRLIAAGARMDGVIAMGGDFRSADFTRAVLIDADFSGARLDHARFDDADVSGASFVTATGLKTASFARAWAWSDQPPAGLPEDMRVDLCSPGLNNAKRRAYLRARPAQGGARPTGC